MTERDTDPIFTVESMHDVEELLEAAAGYVEQTCPHDQRIANELREGAAFVRQEASDPSEEELIDAIEEMHEWVCKANSTREERAEHARRRDEDAQKQRWANVGARDAYHNVEWRLSEKILPLVEAHDEV